MTLQDRTGVARAETRRDRSAVRAHPTKRGSWRPNPVRNPRGRKKYFFVLLYICKCLLCHSPTPTRPRRSSRAPRWLVAPRLPPGRLAEPARRLRARRAAPLAPRRRRGLFVRPPASFLFRRPGHELRPLRHQRLVAASPLLRARLGNLLLFLRRLRLRLPARRVALARLRLLASNNLEVRVAVAVAVCAFALALVARGAGCAWASLPANKAKDRNRFDGVNGRKFEPCSVCYPDSRYPLPSAQCLACVCMSAFTAYALPHFGHACGLSAECLRR